MQGLMVVGFIVDEIFRLSEKMAMTSSITLPVNSRVQSQ